MASAIPVVQSGRIRVVKQGSGPLVGPVVYWMFRDQRIRDNWALIHAVDQANKANVPVAIAFNLFDQFLGAKARQLGFMLRGLEKLQGNLESTLRIPFFLFQVNENLYLHVRASLHAQICIAYTMFILHLYLCRLLLLVRFVCVTLIFWSVLKKNASFNY